MAPSLGRAPWQDELITGGRVLGVHCTQNDKLMGGRMCACPERMPEAHPKVLVRNGMSKVRGDICHSAMGLGVKKGLN
jgi:hypothetical protein